MNLMKVFVLRFPLLEETQPTKHKEPQEPKHMKDIKLEVFPSYHGVRIL